MQNHSELSEYSEVIDVDCAENASLIFALLYSTVSSKVVGLCSLEPFFCERNESETKLDDYDVSLVSSHTERVASIGQSMAVFSIPEACSAEFTFAEFWARAPKVAKPQSLLGMGVVAKSAQGHAVELVIELINYSFEFEYRNGRTRIYKGAIKGQLLSSIESESLDVGAKVYRADLFVGFVVHVEKGDHVLIAPFDAVLADHNLRIATREELTVAFPVLERLFKLSNSLSSFDTYLETDLRHRTLVSRHPSTPRNFPKPSPLRKKRIA